MLRFSQRNHALENPPVRIEKEIIGLQFLDRRIQRVIVEQNRAKNAALRIKIVRQRPFEVDVNRHRFRFGFALVSRSPYFYAMDFRREVSRARILICWDCNSKPESARRRRERQRVELCEIQRACANHQALRSAGCQPAFLTFAFAVAFAAAVAFSA